MVILTISKTKKLWGIGLYALMASRLGIPEFTELKALVRRVV